MTLNAVRQLDGTWAVPGTRQRVTIAGLMFWVTMKCRTASQG